MLDEHLYAKQSSVLAMAFSAFEFAKVDLFVTRRGQN
jgi:hypothetical protein